MIYGEVISENKKTIQRGAADYHTNGDGNYKVEGL